MVSMMVSGWFPVESGGLYRIDYAFMRDDTNDPAVLGLFMGLQTDDEDQDISPAIDQYLNGRRLPLLDGDIPSSFILPDVWRVDSAYTKIPANHRYMRLLLGESHEVGSQPNYYFDNIRVYRTRERMQWPRENTSIGDRSIGQDTWVRPWLETRTLDVTGIPSQWDTAAAFVPGNRLTPSEHEYVVHAGGHYSIIGGVTLDDLAQDSAMVARLTRNGSPLAVGPVAVSQGAFAPPTAVVSWDGALEPGDSIQLWAKHNDSTSRTIDDSECRLLIQQMP